LTVAFSNKLGTDLFSETRQAVTDTGKSQEGRVCYDQI
jgi:hypothetical protein